MKGFSECPQGPQRGRDPDPEPAAPATLRVAGRGPTSRVVFVLDGDGGSRLGQREAVGQLVAGECRAESVGALGEVGPALEVDWHDRAGAEDLGGLGGSFA